MALATSGDPVLDSVIGGGFPPGSMIVIAGPPGSGKTILAQQVAFANATGDRKALYYTTWSEPHEKLVRHLEPFDFFETELLGDRVEFLHLGGLVEAGGLAAVADEIVGRSLADRPAVVVIDSSKALHDVVEPSEFRRAVYDLASKVAHSGAVLILVGEYDLGEARREPEFAVADGILQLENESHGPSDRRWLRVLKMRGAEVAAGRHSFRIGREGFRVYRRLETTLPPMLPALEGRASSGVPGLDEVIGGGIPRGDTTLVIGPTGVGKTMLGMHFANAGIVAGERCLYLTFQENEDQLRTKAARVGMNWHDAGDRLVVRHFAPVELDLDVVAAMVREEIERAGVGRVVVDSLAELAFAARETERFPAYVWSLGGFIRASGGTTLFTNEMAALGAGSDLGGISFLFNNVIFLRYVEIESELRRGLNILKMRESAHERTLREYTVDEGGVRLGAPIDVLSGLLGWTALRGE